MASNSNLIFSAGVPTAPDVERLSESYPELKEGQVITKEEISSIIATPANTHRWRTVFASWRRKLERESNIVLRAVPTVGYRVSDPMDRVDISGSKYKGGVRQLNRAARIAARTDRVRLTMEAARACDHIVMTTGQVNTLLAVEAKKLRYPEAKQIQ